MGDFVTAPDDDAGQDRDHREHARSQRQQQPCTEEEGNDQPETTALEQPGDLRAFGYRCW